MRKRAALHLYPLDVDTAVTCEAQVLIFVCSKTCVPFEAHFGYISGIDAVLTRPIISSTLDSLHYANMSFPIGIFSYSAPVASTVSQAEQLKTSSESGQLEPKKPSETKGSLEGSVGPRSTGIARFFKRGTGIEGAQQPPPPDPTSALSGGAAEITISRARSRILIELPRSKSPSTASDSGSLRQPTSHETTIVADNIDPGYLDSPRTLQASSKSHSRHVEIVTPYSKDLSNTLSTPAQPVGLTTPPSDTVVPSEMDRSTVSSRTSTLDSATSAPSPNQLYSYSRKGSSAQISVNSSVSSLGGRDDYASASEQESLHSAQNSGQRQGRANGSSPAIGGTPNSSTNLSGLVCNVHRTTGKEPPALVGATTTVLGDKLYVFGGRRVSRSRPNLTSDLYELDLLHRHWTKIDTRGDIPSPRYFHSICALGDGKLVCYGGMSSPEAAAGQSTPLSAEPSEGQVTVMSDVHIYDVPTFSWTRVATTDAPQGRYAHCAAILPSSAVFASASAPVSAIHHNPPGAKPNSGSLGVQIDGAGGAQMIVVGGQDSANHYIEQISVFNLRSLTWISTTPMSGRSCGAYRSVVTPLTTMSAAKIGAGPGRPDEEEDDGDDDFDDADAHISGSPMLVYTNYNFLDVKLELQVRLPDGSLVDKPMQGAVSPPGLRFPSGGVIDNNFVVAGTFLTSSKQEYSLWSLDLRTLAWARIDTGSNIFNQGSWNRGVLWNRRNAFVILGNRKRNLVDDYNNRRLNFSNVCIVQLEAFGLYDNPRKVAPTSDYISGSAPIVPPMSHVEFSIGGRQLSQAAEDLGELSLATREFADMDFLALDGTRLPVNSRLIARRWGPSFNALLRECAAPEGTDTATLRAPGSSILSRNSSITITPSLGSSSSTATTLAAHTPNTTTDLADARALPPNSRPRTIYLPHTVPTLQTLLHYFYTSALPPVSSHLSTPQILCSLLQLARPYKIDGLLEAVLERLHEALDGRNAAAIFNATAMGAGGGACIDYASTGVASPHPPRTVSLAGLEGVNIGNGGSRIGGDRGPLRIDTEVANGLATGRSTTRQTARGPDTGASVAAAEDDDVPDSASTANSLGSQLSLGSLNHQRREDRDVWDGGWSAVIGLQKRGLRGLMEGRRARERGRGDSTFGEGRIGLGIA